MTGLNEIISAAVGSLVLFLLHYFGIRLPSRLPVEPQPTPVPTPVDPTQPVKLLPVAGSGNPRLDFLLAILREKFAERSPVEQYQLEGKVLDAIEGKPATK